MPQHPITPILSGLAAILSTTVQLFAGQDKTVTLASTPPPTGWLLDFNAGLALTQGNTNSFGLSLGIDAERRWNGWQLLGKGNYNFAEVQNVTTTNALRLGLQLNRDLTKRWYVGIANAFTYDEVADLDYRYQLGLVLGYRVWTTDRSEFTLEAGPGYTWERQGGVNDDYVNIRFAERFLYRFSENSRFIQSIEYQPSIQDFSRYVLVAEAAITTRIAGNLWWRTAVRDVFNSQPPAGLEQNDLQLTTGISYGLGDPEAKPAPAAKVRKKSDVVKPTAAPSRPENVWQTTAALGFSLTQGNASNLVLVGDLSTSMVSKPHEYFLGLNGGYGEVSKVRNLQNLRANGQYNRLLTDRFYVGAGCTALTDAIADLDYRITPNAILGCKLINTDRVSLRFEAGPGYTWQKQGGISSDYVTLIARERFEVAISESAKVWQSATAEFDMSDSENTVLTAEVGVDFWLTENISVRTVASDIYDNQPAIGAKANDFRLTSGIAISF